MPETAFTPTPPPANDQPVQTDVRDDAASAREERRRSHEAAREAVRQVRQAGRQAVREAREAARQASKESLETVRESMRLAREAEAEVARQSREGRRGPRTRGAGEPGETDTRTRIQQVALELFTEHGYEATSLREIAERLNVTKAALYYHFRTKDEILDSLVNDRVEQVTELIAWAQTQPRTTQTRHDFLTRYAALLHEHDHHGLMRFFERNQSSMGQHKAGSIMKERMAQMLDILSDPTAPLPDQIRSSMAIFALHATWFVVRDPEITDDQRRRAALEVALDLVR